MKRRRDKVEAMRGNAFVTIDREPMFSKIISDVWTKQISHAASGGLASGLHAEVANGCLHLSAQVKWGKPITQTLPVPDADGPAAFASWMDTTIVAFLRSAVCNYSPWLSPETVAPYSD